MTFLFAAPIELLEILKNNCVVKKRSTERANVFQAQNHSAFKSFVIPV